MRSRKTTGRVGVGYPDDNIGFQQRDALAPSWAYTYEFFRTESKMLDINPIAYKISDLKGRVESLRGYL